MYSGCFFSILVSMCVLCFPSHQCSPHDLAENTEMDGTTDISVVSNWPTQPWYLKLMRMVVKPPVMARHLRTLLHLPRVSEEVHPLNEKLDLMICLVSGKT